MFGTVFLFIGLAACAFAAVRRREEVRLFFMAGDVERNVWDPAVGRILGRS